MSSGKEILSRDRSKTDKRGMSQGAPEAVQVADRFHLLQNLAETLEKVFKGHAQALKRVEMAQLQADGLILPHPPEPQTSVPLSPRQLQRDPKRAQRLERYEHVHALRKQGDLIKDIAHHLGMGKRTVYTDLSHPTFPEWQPSFRSRRSGLDAYKPYLLEQWNQGHQQTQHLFEIIQQQGYSGSYETVTRDTRQLRQSQPRLKPTRESLNDLPGRGPAPPVKTAHQKPLSARRAAGLILKQAETP